MSQEIAHAMHLRRDAPFDQTTEQEQLMSEASQPIFCHIEQIYDVPLYETSAIATIVHTVAEKPHDNQNWVDILVAQGDQEQSISFSRGEMDAILPYLPRVLAFMGLLDQAREAFVQPLLDPPLPAHMQLHEGTSFCSVMTCPCHEEKVAIQSLNNEVETGNLTRKEADDLYHGKRDRTKTGWTMKTRE